MTVESDINNRIKYVTARGSISPTHRKMIESLVVQDEWWKIRADHAVASVICVNEQGASIGFAMLEGKHEGPAEFWERIAGQNTAEIGSVIVSDDYRRMGIANTMILVLHGIAINRGLTPVIACYEDNAISKRMIERDGLFQLIGTFNEIGPTFHAYSVAGKIAA